MPGTTARTTTQTTRIGGVRKVITTKAGKVTIADAPVLEWVLQAAQVAALRKMPEYGKQFLLAGGMEAGRRGMNEQVKAKATGMTAGHPDLTIFLPGAKIAMIENKAEKGRLSQEQKERHAALANIGHNVVVLRSAAAPDAAERAVALVRGWLEEEAVTAANDNSES